MLRANFLSYPLKLFNSRQGEGLKRKRSIPLKRILAAARRWRWRLHLRIKDRPLRPSHPFTLIRYEELDPSAQRPRLAHPSCAGGGKVVRYFLWPDDLRLYFVIAGVLGALPCFFSPEGGFWCCFFLLFIAVFFIPWLLYHPCCRFSDHQRVLSCLRELPEQVGGIPMATLFDPSRCFGSQPNARMSGLLNLRLFVPRLFKPRDTRLADPRLSARSRLVVLGIADFFSDKSGGDRHCQRSVSRWWIYWIGFSWTGYLLFLIDYFLLPNDRNTVLGFAILWSVLSTFFIYRQACIWLHLGQLEQAEYWREETNGLLSRVRVQFDDCGMRLHFPKLDPLVVQGANLLPAVVIAILTLLATLSSGKSKTDETPCDPCQQYLVSHQMQAADDLGG